MSQRGWLSRGLACAVAAWIGFHGGILNAQDVPASTGTNDVLTIGSKAPALDIEHWVQNGNGRFQPVTEFAPGKVYLVEFWATWCGPCIKSMAHLSETQEKYADRGLTIISVSIEDLETVKTFLERDYTLGDHPGKTFADVTRSYCLTTDPDGSVYASYMEAAMQDGIPTAFLVGKDGHIEWVGHPVDMDEPLAKVLDGSWDRNAFAETFKAMQEAAARERVLNAKLQEVFSFLRNGEMDQAMEKLAAVIEEADGQLKSQLRFLRINLTLTLDEDAAIKEFDELVELHRREPEMLNQFSWAIYEMHEQGQPLPAALKDSSLRAAELAVKSSPDDGAILDTLAHWLWVFGDLERAIQVQTKAMENPGPAAQEIEAFLKFLQQEKAKKDKDQRD